MCDCVLKNFAKTRRIWWRFGLSPDGANLFQPYQSGSATSLGHGTSSALWGGHQNHQELYAPETQLLRHTAAHWTSLWTLTGDQFRSVTSEPRSSLETHPKVFSKCWWSYKTGFDNPQLVEGVFCASWDGFHLNHVFTALIRRKCRILCFFSNKMHYKCKIYT